MNQTPEAVSVVCDANGFRVTFRPVGEPEEEVQGLWGNIVLVAAYKKNYFAFEVVCVQLQMSSGKKVEVSESDEGFAEFAARLTQRIPDVDKNWLHRLMERPADGTVQTLFRKGWF